MDLFIIKTDEGYIKYNSSDDIKLVGIEKASVFNESRLPFLKSIMNTIKQKGFVNIRIAQLRINETDFFFTHNEI